MTPLLSRIGTAVLLLAVFVPAAWWAPAWLWGILMAGVVGMAAYEWARLSHFPPLSARVYAILLTLCALVLPYGLAGGWPAFQIALIVLAIVFWLLVAPLWLLGRWEASRVFVRAAIGVVILLPTWVYTLLGSGATPGAKLQAVSEVFFIMNIGAVAGYALLIWLVDWVGRRWSYFLFCFGAYACSVIMFTQAHTYQQLLFYVFFLGFFANGGFGTFAIYLPELFPTRFRATGQGFCWNVARMFTGVGPFVTGLLVTTFGSVPYASLGISWVFAFGLVAIWFGPETRGTALTD